MFTFAFHPRGHARLFVPHYKKTAASAWRNILVIKVTSSSTPPTSAGPVLPVPPLFCILFCRERYECMLQRAMLDAAMVQEQDIVQSYYSSIPATGSWGVYFKSMRSASCRRFGLKVHGTDTCCSSLHDLGRNRHLLPRWQKRD